MKSAVTGKPAELVRFPLALAAVILSAIVVLSGTGVLLWLGLGSPSLGVGVPPVSTNPTGPAPTTTQLTTQDQLNMVQIALIITGGLGGVVALVVAYRKQRIAEDAHRWADEANQRAIEASSRDDTRLFNERFTAASAQLGHESAAVRLAGVYAIAGLADDWQAGRQTCINVLCAYLRMPYQPDPKAEEGGWIKGEREVRLTIITIIRDHLRADPDTDTLSWRGHELDFTGATFDSGDFSDAHFTANTNFANTTFSGGEVGFVGATFSGGTVWFGGAAFSGGSVGFVGATFSGGTVWFGGATFSGGEVRFDRATFSGGTVWFGGATFSGGEVRFDRATFSGGEVRFDRAAFSGGEVRFDVATFSGGTVRFDVATFSGGEVRFVVATFSGGTVWFDGATFSSGEVRFDGATFSSGTVGFDRATFSGGEVGFVGAKFSGGTVRFVVATFSGGTVEFFGARFSGGTVGFEVATFSGGTVGFDGATFSGGEVGFVGARFSGGTVDLSILNSYQAPPQFDPWTTPPIGLKLPQDSEQAAEPSSHSQQTTTLEDADGRPDEQQPTQDELSQED
ncbi:hypothetical protein Cs7R123_66730 [Catellatospora sp. TT07R-123]|uniref:pentapeptide repeat-containing protein n=1 Tax=Catellatospora sp. TT07R-123 TaxID=2733863 RepID=UPI001B1948B5|nr:pentapeptide repeat-containing protein [Catellatospora sp. TT07R-123]GHJ49331.1 hypothetical protein Cs7R123_66730 [Catellatospora sp. TT07R-123]